MTVAQEPILAPNGAQTDSTSQDEKTKLSQAYDTPLGLAHTTMAALKDRIKQHYDLASDYYLNLWYVKDTGVATTCLKDCDGRCFGMYD